MVAITSWGRLSNQEHLVLGLERNNPQLQLENCLKGLPFGMGRSYGDSCLNPGGALWKMRHLDRFIEFEPKKGLLKCEPGVLLRDIQEFMIPRGWSLPVTPGTQIVTVGGAIANDVHGKNHFSYGSFGNHIKSLNLLRTDGSLIQCSASNNRDWFEATIGGLGLTGLIVEAEIQLKRTAGPWLEVEVLPFHSLNELFELSNQSESNWEFNVAWVDCMLKKKIRGIFSRANTSASKDQTFSPRSPKLMPFTPPVSLVNRLTLKPFNEFYFRSQKLKKASQKLHYQQFFYPLDGILEWNRMYGRRGFYQYQFVIGSENIYEVLKEILDVISKSGEGSFLAVLKTFGNIKSQGLLSFPMPGVTLALDFPNKGQSTLKLFSHLDQLVKEANGRLYAAKDARMSKDMFEAGYPNLAEFKKFRDPGISSAMSRRLFEN